ncbi:MAG: UUP1 family membrane protein [Cyanobacteria bacterium P01_A01_bin.83]
MKRTFHALLLALFLAAIGMGIFIHKLTTSDVPFLPNRTFDTWYVEAKVTLDTAASLSAETEAPASIRLHLPQDSQRYEIKQEDFISNGFEHIIETNQENSNREAVFNQKNNYDNSEYIFYRANIKRKPRIEPGEEEIPLSGRRLVNRQMVRFGENTERVEENLNENLPISEIKSLLQEAQSNSDGTTLSFAHQAYLLALETDDIRINSVRRNVRKPDSTVQITAFILERAGVPVRIGNGIYLRADEIYSTDFVEWLEVKEKDRWLAYDPLEGGFTAQNPYLTWWYGNDRVLQVKGADRVDISVVVQPNTNNGITRDALGNNEKISPFLAYSFLRLPLATQRVLQILVLIPIGALIVSVLHQMIGLNTFGTFTPILISLAFRQTGILVGIPLFILVVLIGLLFRGYLDRLQLLIVPRLAAILTTTVLIIGFMTVLMQGLGINLGLSVSLFPIVILAMTIERASSMWSEDGAKDTIIAGLGTILVSVTGYFCMFNDYIQHWAFVFPELLLIVLAINIMVGRYNSYKLTEYFRFRSLQNQLNQAN